MGVPKKVLHLADLKTGSQVRMGVENGRVVFEPQTKPRYTLAELLVKSSRQALKSSREDREWLSGGPVGKEAI
jgi:antitoxin ChpS